MASRINTELKIGPDQTDPEDGMISNSFKIVGWIYIV